MSIKHYRDTDGNYLGAYSDGNPNIPNGAIEVPEPPQNASQIWNGSVWEVWVEPPTAPNTTSYYNSGDIALSSGSKYTLTHTLSGVPNYIQVFLVCTDDNNGYEAGDLVAFYPQANSGDDGMSIVVDQTTITVRIARSGWPFDIIDKDSGRSQAADPDDWNFRIVAMR